MPRHPNGRPARGIKNARSVTLHEDLIVEQWAVPAGTVVKAWETENFGWVFLPEGCMDRRGFVIPRRLFNA
jgi:hypothetical protein